MTLTPEQRAAAIEAMARAICKAHGHNPDKTINYTDGVWKYCISPAVDALAAALPIIKAAMASDKPVGENG